ncbi:AAA family ATPase [Caldimonas caldifontis]|uniref:ATPase n=1 Tax=Caldimonas caldifontis TaxID=1452508 RepID=A0A2S5SWN6_9BURK|nr:ATP-binding protein [Caldimonas caldifontis]PPE66987.1 ATPase [Caldimonas caldifontis]
MIVALLGAESTGKTDLAHALARRAGNQGLRATAVEEYLREFCEHRARTPRPDEQTHIAEEQTRRIRIAAAHHALVLADTTALMTAVYSDLLFDDPTLYDAALAAHAECHLTLVTGLDLPWTPDGIQRDGPHVRVPVDTRLRTRLQDAGVPFSVVYGQGQDRVEAAWRAIVNALAAMGGNPRTAEDAPANLQPWCRECLVPECEHQLFRRLVRD